MGLKRWWRQHGAQPKGGGRVVPDSMTDMLAQLYTKQPDYRYLSKQLMTYNEMMQLQQATPRHTVRAQNESVIQCSCGDYFLRERYPGHIADVV